MVGVTVPTSDEEPWLFDLRPDSNSSRAQAGSRKLALTPRLRLSSSVTYGRSFLPFSLHFLLCETKVIIPSPKGCHQIGYHNMKILNVR